MSDHSDDLTVDPITILEHRQHAIANRAAQLGIELRNHLTATTTIRRELTDLNDAAKATGTLLAIHRAVAAIPPKTTNDDTPPKARAARRQPATKDQP